MNKLSLFKNSQLSKQDFLDNYWHKKPVLIRNAVDLDSLKELPNKKQLIKLCNNPEIQSRIVLKNNAKSFDIKYTPFQSNYFDIIKNKCWNLLVSDIDKWHPESKKILCYFDFIRNWVFDDIMLSCGSINGTVGPHIDHYDVFLLQVQGQRKWQYSNNKSADPLLIPEQPIKVMSDFKADETHLLNSGDVLYIPPEIPHYGVSKTDDNITCSIGLRTPSYAELMTSFVDDLAQKMKESIRFVEPALSVKQNKGEITQADLDTIHDILKKQLNINKAHISQWFGQYISEYRNLFYEVDHEQNNDNITSIKNLTLNSFTKCCYIQDNKSAQLFINGDCFHTSLALAEHICIDEHINLEHLNNYNNDDLDVIKELIESCALIEANI